MITKPKPRTFAAFAEALKWARTYAHEHCHPFHFWRVERLGHVFVVAVRSKTTGLIAGYAH